MAKRKPDEHAFITHGELRIPVSIYFERRRNTRISIGAETIHLRLPKNLDQKEFNDQLLWAQKWLHKRFEKAPTLLERFKTVAFHDGDRIQIMRDVYVLHLKESNKKASEATLSHHDIYITINGELEGAEKNKTIQTLVHKLFCKRYLAFMKRRLQELNEIYFRQPYGRVELKYIHSKWGSCSATGDIVLSSKLLLCPEWARDYVIIHELAHLLEHNHSQDFWDHVASAVRDYKKAEQWLDNEGAALEIRPMQTTTFHRLRDATLEVPASALLDKKIDNPMENPLPLPQEVVLFSQKELLEIASAQAEDSVLSNPEQKKRRRKTKKKGSTTTGEQLSLF